MKSSIINITKLLKMKPTYLSYISIEKKIYSPLIILVFILMVSFDNCIAQNINTPNKTGPMGLEVNTKTGNLFLSRTDIYIPARQLDFDISFSYNSFNYTENKGYGNGWIFMYGMQYKIDTAGRIVIVWGDGREDIYSNNGSRFIPQVGFFDSLSQYQSGKYLLKTKGGLQFYFDNNVNKRLTKVQEPNGNLLNFTYTDSLITGITNSSGQTVTLGYTNGNLTSVTDANAAPVQTYTYSYDASGNLIKITDPMGGTIKYTYLVNGPMSGVTDKNGNVADIIYYPDFSARELITCNSRTSFSYDTTVHTTTVIDFLPAASNQTTTYIYNDKGWLSQLIGSCCGYNMTFTYDNNGNLTERKDANGNVYKYTYDNRGNYLTITDPLNNVSTYSYSADFNSITSITDPQGNIYTMNYDVTGNPTLMTKPGSLQQTFTYNANGDLLTAKDENNNTTNFLYDAYGYPQKITMPLSTEVSSTFDGRGNLLSGKNPNGNAYSYQYDSLNRIKKVTDPLGHSQSVTYDKESNITSYTDSKGFKSILSYDASNRMVRMKDAMGATSVFSYDAMHNLTTVTDALGKTTSLNYDNQNRLTTVTDAEGNGYSFNYDAVGNMISAVNPIGNTINNTYDQLNRVISSSDNTGSMGNITYDKNGKVTSYTNATGAAVTMEYDNLNRLTRITDPLGNSRVFTYDNVDHLLTQKDRNNHTSSYTYNALNRVTSFTDNNNNTITPQYDSVGNVTAITDQNGNSTNYQYDVLNRPVKTTYPDGSNITVTYDNNDNILSKKLTDGSNIIYTYDSTNRLIAKDLPSGEHFTYTYDAKHRLISSSNAAGIVSFVYDNVDRVISETFNAHITAYAYNVPGKTITTTYPNGTIVTKSFDNRSRLTGLTVNNQQLASFQYNSINQLLQKTYSNGVTTSYQYDNANRLNSISSSKSNLPGMSFQYDNEMNKTLVARTNDPQYSETFSYDANNRLTNYKQGILNGNSISSPLIQNSYTYDAVGNRISASLNGSPTSYTVNNLNQYTQVAGTNFTYDGNGNQAFDGQFYMRYDAEGRKILDSSASLVNHYAYDALGRRVVKSVNGIPVNYYYSGLKQIEERDMADNVTGSQVFEASYMPLMRLTNNQKYFYHQNDMNSTEAITDSSGNLIERYKYEDFGKTSIYDAQNNSIASSSINNRFLYTGQEYDAQTSKYNFHFRNYDPGTGNFDQRDPIGYADQMGMYQYVGNNPGSNIDLLGLQEVCTKEVTEKHEEDKKETLGEWWKEWWERHEKEFEIIHHGNHTIEWTLEKFSKGFNSYYGESMREFATDFATEMANLKGLNSIEHLQALRTAYEPVPVLKEAIEGLGKLGFGLNVANVGINTLNAGNTFLNSNSTIENKGEATTNLLLSGSNFNPFGAATNLTFFAFSNIPGYAGSGNLYKDADYAQSFYGLPEVYKSFFEDRYQQSMSQNPTYYHIIYGGESEWYKAGIARDEKIRRYTTHTVQLPNCPANINTHGTQRPPIKTLEDLIKFDVEVIFNHDPNVIIGPDGAGSKKWVSVHDRLPYQILFQNDTSATAPVKVVRVVYPIDPKQDASTFQLGSFGFNNLTFNIPPNTNSYYQRLDLRDSLGLYVDVTAGVDAVNNQAFWILESIDPVTLLPTSDPLKGLLSIPKRSDPNAGHGFVNFSIQPISTAHTRDTISAAASIVFDSNDTLPTNRTVNTIDALPPTSHLNQTVQTITPYLFRLNWQGNDDPGGSGVASYSLYVSVNSQPYTLYRSQITDNTILFKGLRDSTYCFFIAAKDSVKNEEQLSNHCDLSVVLTSVPLPITLLDFSGVRRGDDALLVWSTANEINTKYYSLERSLNGTTFNSIGNVNAANKAGVNNYNFTDVGISSLGVKIIYYRLKEIDIDGRFMYSKIIAIRVDNTTNEPLISAFPNPFNQNITLKVMPASAQDNTSKVELFSLEGALLYRKEIDKQGSTITILNDLPTLVSGMYILKTVVNGISYSVKMIKN